MDCPFLKADPCGALHDVAINVYDMYIPSFMYHLINRPLQHTILPRTAIGTVNGIVLMEFNKQIFRREIVVPYEDRCSHCKQSMPMKDRYEIAVADAIKGISRDVNRVVGKMLEDALREASHHVR